MENQGQPNIPPFQSTPLPPTTPSINWPKIVIFVLIGAVLVAGSTYAGIQIGKNQIVKQQPIVVQPTISPTQAVSNQATILSTKPTPMTDPTIDWKTYNDKLFSFKYPSNWDTHIIGENSGSTLMVAPKEKVDKVRQIQGGFGGGTFLILTINKKTEPPEWKTDEYWQVTSEPVIVDNISGTKYNINVIQDLPGLSKGDTITSVVIKENNTYIQIDLLDQLYIEIFNQIISTFKFTN